MCENVKKKEHYRFIDLRKNRDSKVQSVIFQLKYFFLVCMQWLTEHSKFKANSFYLSGDSYSGEIVPIVVQEILKGNTTKSILVCLSI